jgi:hypothetical protein
VGAEVGEERRLAEAGEVDGFASAHLPDGGGGVGDGVGGDVGGLIEEDATWAQAHPAAFLLLLG